MMVFNSNGEILLARIGYMHKLWVIPGGKLERSEKPADAARRELSEEVGMEVAECNFVFTMYHEKQYKRDTVHYFEAFSDANDFIIDDEEIVDVAWFSPDRLPELRAARIDDALIEYNKIKSII